MRRVMIYERPQFTASPTPSPSPSPSPSPTSSPTPTPSPTPVGEYLWGSGDNFYGQLAQVTNINGVSSFVGIGAFNDWVQVAQGYGRVLFAKRSNNIWYCAGQNGFGELGLNDLVDRSSLTQFDTATNWNYIESAASTTYGSKTDGTLWGWGDNNTDWVGTGININYSSPVQILSNVQNWSVNLGGLAVKKDGTLWGWGRNGDGQLGFLITNPPNDVTTPSQISTGTNWKAVAKINDTSIMLKQDGTIWGMGENAAGQLSQNNTINYSSPVQIGTSNTWTRVYGGYFAAYALKNDNTLWAWGYNYRGSLGINQPDGNYSSMVQVVGNINYAQIAVKWKWVSVIDTAGKMWVWGQNSYGQLGFSDFVSRSSPTQVAYPNQFWRATGNAYGNIFGIVGTAPAPTATPFPTFNPTASPTPQPTGSPTPLPTNSPTPAPTNSPTPQPTASATPAPTASRTPTPTASPVPTNTATPAPTASVTPNPTPSPTSLPAPSPTIDTTGTTIDLCFTEPVTRSVGDTGAITFAGFNSAYGNLSIASYASGDGTTCLEYNLNRPVYSDETAITVTYDSSNCYLARLNPYQCLPTYNLVPVNNTSTKAPPTPTPTASRSPTPTPTVAPATPTPSASAAAATATPTPSPSVSPPAPSPTGFAGCYSQDVAGLMDVTATTYGFDYSNQFTKGSSTFLFTVLADCNDITFTVFVDNQSGTGDVKILPPNGAETIVGPGTTACQHFTGVQQGESVGVGKGTAGATYGAGTVTGYIVTGGSC